MNRFATFKPSVKARLQSLAARGASVAVSVLGVMSMASAADPDTSAITAAGTAILAALAVIFGVMAGVWGAKKLQSKTVGN